MSYEQQQTARQRLRPDLRFNPVRPSGLGEMKIGESGEFGQGQRIDWRKTTATHNSADGSTTYSYHGELELSDPSRRTAFTAGEKIDANKKLIWSWVNYTAPVEQDFLCPDVGSVTIKNILTVHSEYGDWSTGYFTVVMTANGDCHRFVTSPDGIVVWYEHGYSFHGSPVNPLRPAKVSATRVVVDNGKFVRGSKAGAPSMADPSSYYRYFGGNEQTGPLSRTVQNYWQAKKSIRLRA